MPLVGINKIDFVICLAFYLEEFMQKLSLTKWMSLSQINMNPYVFRIQERVFNGLIWAHFLDIVYDDGQTASVMRANISKPQVQQRKSVLFIRFIRLDLNPV